MVEFGFVSLDWLLWMIVTTVSFWSIPAQYRSSLIVLFTLVFLGLHDFQSCGLLIVLTLTTYAATRKQVCEGGYVLAAIGLIVGILAFYKLMNAALSRGGEFSFESIVPLGLSYYALRCIHFIIERYKGKIDEYSLNQLISYLFFLPTIWVGPIHRFAQFEKDQRRHRWDPDLFSRGLERILYGYFKVAIISNIFLNKLYLQWQEGLAAVGPQLSQYLEMVRGGLDLYVQFSGYSDIAIGFGYLLGFRVMENFQSPYLQKNISAFWRSWHISLTSWCREYIYTSVISRVRSPALGAIATLIVIGLWHEISLRYIAWGIYHGVGIVIWQYSQLIRNKLPTIHSLVGRRVLDGLSITLTVHFVWLGFLLVRQDDLASFVAVVKLLFLGVT